MAKKEIATPKEKVNQGKVSDGHRIGDTIKPKAWQPTTDKTTTPPKGNSGNEKK